VSERVAGTRGQPVGWAPARVHGLAAVLGVAVGVVSAAFLGAVQLLIHLVWVWFPAHVALIGDHRAVATLAVCTAGGVVVGVVKRGRHAATHEGVHDLDETLAAADGPAPSAAGLLRLATLGILSLTFGASLGPEAPLIAVVAGLAGRLHGVVRLAREEAVQISVSGALGGLFGAPLGAVAAPVEAHRGTALAERLARVAPSVVAALAALLVLLAVLPDGTLDAFTVPDDAVTGPGLSVVWVVVAGVLGALGGRLLHSGVGTLQRLTTTHLPAMVVRGAVGGLVLGLCGALTPLALFSGHHEIQELFDGFAERSLLALLTIAALKAVAVMACLSTGWSGGEIFPAAMVGAALGLAVAVVTGTDAWAGCAAAGMVAAAGAVIRRPASGLLVLVFFLPAGTLVAATIGAVMAAVVGVPRPPPVRVQT
jgi:H+/Cl- antiporter ClcA